MQEPDALRQITTGARVRLLDALLIGAIAIGLALALLRVLFDQFDTDELQHTHIAWLTAGGEVPYRDFWDHHGPLYSLFNAALSAAAEPVPGVELQLALRAINWGLAVGLVILTFRLGRAAAATRPAALAAAALLAATYHFQDVGTEIRPDVLQNVCWLAGLLLVARQLERPLVRTAVAAGALFGLAVVTNMKAILGPMFVAVFYALAVLRDWLPRRRAMADCLLFTGGALLPLVPILAWFWREDALEPLLRMTTLWNLAAVGIDAVATPSRTNLLFFLTRQTPLLLAFAVGAWLVIRHLRYASESPVPKAQLLVLVTGTGTAAFWSVNYFYPQYLLICLPLIAVTAGPGLLALGSLAGRAWRPPESRATVVVAGLALFYLLGMAAVRTPITTHPNLLRQQELTAYVLANSTRDEPIGVFFGACAGYVFNRNVQYWWAAAGDVGIVIDRYSGEDAFGSAMRDRLGAMDVRWLVGREDVAAGLPPETVDYIKRNFDYQDCLWTAKRPTADGSR